METVDPIVVAILLYIAAVGLALIDTYVPSAGMLVVLSFVAAVGSIMFGFRAGTTAGMTMLTLVAASVPILAIVALRIWPHTPIGRRIVLGLPADNSPKNSADQASLTALVGIVVDSEYPLMPGGQLTIARKPYNALAEAGYIEAGQRVEVVAVRQRNLIVRVTDRPLTPTTPRDPLDPAASPTATSPTATSPAHESLLDVPADQLGLNSLDE